MSADRDERIERLLRNGVPKAQIARRVETTRQTVDRVAARVGFPAKGRGAPTQDWEAIRAMYEAGASAAACIREFGLPPGSWRVAIARGDIVPRPRGRNQQAPGKTRNAVEELLNQGRGIAEIAERLRISKPTVCYHARKLGVAPRKQFARRFDWEEIARSYDGGLSMRECMLRFGFSSYAWSNAVKRGDIVPRDRLIPIQELLVIGRQTSRTHLKSRLVAAGLKENKCERCGITEWQGEPMNMQLHHRNGDGLDNRFENLEFLCANCHSLTDTWSGRNRKRKPAPGRDRADDAA
jgi:DNA-binding CsgD family transcriptional regulator